MNPLQFIKYLETHLNNLDLLQSKFYHFQQEKNLAKDKSKRQSDQQVQTQANKMYQQALTNIYNNIANSLKNDAHLEFKWINFLEQEDFLESLEQSFEELDLFDN